MHVDRSAGRTVGRVGAAVAACIALLSAVGCSSDAGGGVRDAAAPDGRASAAAPVKAAGKASERPAPSMPEPAEVAQARVNISDRQTVG
ncbi:hypothetical protein ACWGKT_47455, partial [Streptomyces sp. NPDC054794]